MKRAILKVFPSQLGLLFKKSKNIKMIESGLPKDAKFLGCNYSWERQTFFLVYESEEFSEVKEGEMLPVLPNTTLQVYEMKGD